MSNYYDVQQVCLNGHQITALLLSHSEGGKPFCDKCGVKTISQCPHCNAPIRGYRHVDGVVSFSDIPVPEFCIKCGTPFPWTLNKTDEKPDEEKFDALETLQFIADGFDDVVKELRRRYSDRETLDVKDEYDVQDLLRSLLRLYFEDIRPEEWTPSYAGGSSRMDFLLKDEKTVIETKMTRKGLDGKEIGKELIIDIAKYQAHQDCKTLFCLVYDPDGRIANPRGLEKDLSRDSDDFSVIVRIVR